MIPGTKIRGNKMCVQLAIGEAEGGLAKSP